MDTLTIKNAVNEPAIETSNFSISDKVLGGIGNSKVGLVVPTDPDPDDLLLDEKEKEEEARLVKEKEDKEKKDLELEGKNKNPEDKKEDTNEEDSFISILKGKFGEQEGDFEESTDGILDFTSKAIEKARQEAKLEAEEELLDSKPELKALKEHLDAGYGVQSFLQKQQNVDWDKVVIKKGEDLNLPLCERIFKEAHRVRGIDDDEIEEAWETAKDKDTVEARTIKAMAFLKKEQDEYVATIQKQEKTINDDIKEKEATFIKDYNKVVDGGKVLGLQLPVDKLKDLKKFALEVDKKGQTARDKRIDAMTTEETAFFDYLLMTGFKDFGIKEKSKIAEGKDTFQKLKDEQNKRKSVNLGGNGLDGKTKHNIDVRSIFNN